MKKAKIDDTKQKVILHDDGTWEFYESINDIINYVKDDLIIEETDKMTKKSFFRFKESISVPNKFEEKQISFLASSEKNEEYLFLGIHVYGAGDCISEDNKIIFLFKDEQTITLDNTNDFNCDNHFTLYLTNSLHEYTINKLKLVQLASVRVYTVDGSVEVDFDEKNSLKFQKSINLVLDNC